MLSMWSAWKCYFCEDNCTFGRRAHACSYQVSDGSPVYTYTLPGNPAPWVGRVCFTGGNYVVVYEEIIPQQRLSHLRKFDVGCSSHFFAAMPNVNF